MESFIITASDRLTVNRGLPAAPLFSASQMLRCIVHSEPPEHIGPPADPPTALHVSGHPLSLTDRRHTSLRSL
ncbi:hypothetical protein PBY51_019035 [Eleginops maclovinus]|uniref:Uncharacterized protein n=1 Tax=Eleginops maclovinus TaxID=56733 RepID=A0AAN7YBP1_ELEMC|nr:hypothetical protein PBY51_019033 [Eleginops maclovinus]KAK5874054.1 hypothetical protein PBY51_019035 [Eleginops maclovinus]